MAPHLKVKASLDRSDYDKGLELMKAGSKSLNQSLGGLGGLMAGVFGGNLITRAVESTFGKMRALIEESHASMIKLGSDSENIGAGIEDLESKINVFEHFGQSGEVVVSMFGRMAAARDKALGGNQKMIDSFDDLGISVQQLVNMSPDELFDAIAQKYANSSGASRSAAGDIFGRGVKNAGVSRSLSAYGQGERYDAFAEPSEVDIVKAQIRDRANKRFMKGVGNLLLGGLTYAVDNTFVGSTYRGLTGTTDANAEFELKKRKAEQDKQPGQNAESLSQSEREANEKAAAKREEIESGIKLSHPETDSYAKRGLLAGGSGFNSQAYAIGRQQVQLAHQLLESSRRIEAQLKVKGRGASDMGGEVE